MTGSSVTERPPVVRSRAGHVLHALSLLREPGWALGLVGVIVLSIAFTWLGDWQFGRHEGKVVRNEHIDTNYDAPPAELAAVLPTPTSALPVDQQWRPVRVTGTYDVAGTTLVRNRPLNGVYGYEVVVPLRLASGGTLLVDRGWVPNGRTGAEPDAVPAAPSGPVTVVARLRPSEPGVHRTPPAGQELRIDIPRITARITAGGTGGTDGGVYQGAYGVLASEQPTPQSAPTLLPRPDEDLGPHLSYSVQWVVFALAAFGIFFYYLGQEARRRDGLPPPPPLAQRWRARRGRGPTDEEWEDAASG